MSRKAELRRQRQYRNARAFYKWAGPPRTMAPKKKRRKRVQKKIDKRGGFLYCGWETSPYARFLAAVDKVNRALDLIDWEAGLKNDKHREEENV